MYRRYKARIYDILSIRDPDDAATMAVNYFLVVLIALNIVAFFFSTLQDVYAKYHFLFNAFEAITVAAFTVEYLLRLWTIDLGEKYKGPIKGRVRYAATNPLAITDLLAILPFYVPFVLPFDLVFLRILRLFRLFRVFKLARYSNSLDILERVIYRQREYIILTLVVQFIFLLLAAGTMYTIEHEAQPMQFDNIYSALEWSIMLITGIGPGNVYPITPLGKFVGGVLAFLGFAIGALPVGVIVWGFENEMAHEKSEDRARALRKVIFRDGGQKR